MWTSSPAVIQHHEILYFPFPCRNTSRQVLTNSEATKQKIKQSFLINSKAHYCCLWCQNRLSSILNMSDIILVSLALCFFPSRRHLKSKPMKNYHRSRRDNGKSYIKCSFLTTIAYVVSVNTLQMCSNLLDFSSLLFSLFQSQTHLESTWTNTPPLHGIQKQQRGVITSSVFLLISCHVALAWSKLHYM